MAEYIERDKVVSWLKKVGRLLKSEHNHKEKTALVGKIIDHVENCPVADVVEVVRCRECIYSANGQCTKGEQYDDTRYRPDYFCADGYRSGEGEGG